MLKPINGTDLIVISSHLYGDETVRTTLLMSQMSYHKRVYFFNKPIVGMTKKATFYYSKESHKVTVVQPYLPEMSVFERSDAMISLMKDFIRDEQIKHLTLWTDTPNAMPVIRKLIPEVVVFDKAKPGATPSAKLEEELMVRADIVLYSNIPTEAIQLEIEQLQIEQDPEFHFLNDPADFIVDQRSHLIGIHGVVPAMNQVISKYQTFMN